MKCNNCDSKIDKANSIYWNTQKKDFCFDCYSKIIERKLKANLSKKKMVSDDDVLVLSKEKSAPAVAANYILHKLFDKHPRIKFGKPTSKARGPETKSRGRGKMVNYSAADNILEKFFDSMSMKKQFYLRISGDEIFPIYNFTIEDIKLYCKANSLKYEDFPLKEPFGIFLSRLRPVKPGGLYSFIKSLEEAELIEA